MYFYFDHRFVFGVYQNQVFPLTTQLENLDAITTLPEIATKLLKKYSILFWTSCYSKLLHNSK